MDTKQVALTAKDGHKVFGTHRQATSPRATILLVHGITADRHEWGYYDLVGDSLQKIGVASLAIDYRGHAEIDDVRSLVRDIESGTLDGADWWRQVHERGFDQVPPPFDPSHPHDTSRPGD